MLEVAFRRDVARTDGLAIAALILGAVSIPGSFVLVGFVLGGAAFMMGLVSRSRIAKGEGKLKGDMLALLGLSMGLAGFVLSIALPTLLIMMGTARVHG
jgi:hypothetical protein